MFVRLKWYPYPCILVPVTFILGLEDQYAIEGDEEASFMCAISDPEAEVTWYRESEALSEGEKYSFVAEGARRKLLIRDIKTADQTKYSCATNADKTEANLFVEAFVDFFPGLEDQYAVEQDAQAQFSCKATHPNAEVTWYRSDQKIENSEKYEILVDGFDHTLIIKDIQIKDESSYSCATKHRKTTARLFVEALIDFCPGLEDQFAVEKDPQAQFSCKLNQPNVETTWYREDKKLENSDKYQIIVKGYDHHLIIKDIRQEDDTSYSCATQHRKTTAKLIVGELVDFCPGLEDQYAVEQDAQAQFSCKMTQPDAEATWYRSDEKIENSEKYEIIADGYDHTLIIKDIHLRDETSYSCASKHRKTTAKLFVEALIDFCPGLEDQFAVEKDPLAKFSCKLNQANVETTWYREDEKLENSEKYQIIVKGYDHHLIIKDIRQEDDTSYSCATKHRKTTAKLIVGELVDFAPGLEDQYAIENDAQATFSCKMTQPDAEATWYRSDEKIEASDRYEIIADGYDHTLIIKNIQIKDETSYSCESRHRKTTAKLFVEGLLDILGPEDVYAVEKDTQAQFMCQMTKPAADAVWYKGDEKIEESDKYRIIVFGFLHTLTINDIQLEDEATYSVQSKHRKKPANLFVEGTDNAPGIYGHICC
ncbi:PREDICTED: titin-like [Branchiostoma belcheri]|uniref:Titin-like n=1 Tax=Branchiostoma belcheri TaxID=7741 RepID=A0A6P4YCR2_BRABE|nr:PREDICTED: titin-like [Branchiostoma belcheri]